MKTTLALLSLSAITLSGNAQKIKADEVPSAVKTKVGLLYPNTKIEKWEKEGGNFEAEFDVNKAETSVLLDATGNLLETETAIAITALPKAVSEYVLKNYGGEKIKEASQIVDAKKVITYEAEIKKADLIFDDSGKFIKKVTKQ